MRKYHQMTSSILIAAILTMGIPSIATSAFANSGGGGGGSVGGSAAPRYDPVEEYQKGIEALETSDYKKASSAFGKVLKVARKDANSNYFMGVAQTGLEKHKKAAKYYKSALKYNPDLFQAYPAMASSYVLADKENEARSALTMINERIEECGGSCANASVLAKTKTAVESALAGDAVQKESFLRPNISLAKAHDIQYFDAVALINQSRYEDAINELIVLAADMGPHPDVMNYLGYTHRKLGQFEHAEYFYSVALSVDDNHRGANEYLGELYVETKQYEKAHMQLQKLENICSFGCVEENELREWIDNAAW